MNHVRKWPWQRKQSLLTLVMLLVVSIASARPLTRAEVGELFLFGIPSSEIDALTRSHLQETCPGSLLLFRRNLISNQQTAKLTQDLRKLSRRCSDSPLLIGLDQEGGQVARIPLDPPMPSAWALGLTRDPGLAEELGYQVGKALRKLGFNMNLAPVLDLGDSEKKNFIGSRSFGSDPDLVASVGSAFSLGLVKSHVLPVAKHFPGIGVVHNDPHQMMVRSPASETRLLEKDIKPFREFAQIFPTGMMPSHLIYPSVDSSQTPGTFSKTLLKNWLRDKLNYQGLVISDDLLMAGAKASPDVGKNVVTALKAGVDLVMITWSRQRQKQAVEAVEKAVRTGALAQSLIEEKISRIRKIKQIIYAPISRTLASNTTLGMQGSSRYADLAHEIMQRNLRAQISKIPKDKPGRLLVWPVDLKKKWQLERGLHRSVLLATNPELSRLKETDLIVVFLKKKSDLHELSKWTKKTKKRALVINQLEPGVLVSSFAGEIELFLDHPMVGGELAQVLERRWGLSVARGPR